MNLKPLKKTSRRKADRRWTLLFIGDQGNVITLKRFKAIIVMVGSVLLLAFVLLAVVFWGYQKTQRKYTELQHQFEHSEQKIDTLRHEKEILMARLVLAESKAKDATAEKPAPKENPSTVKPVKPKPQKLAKAKPASEPRKKPSVPVISQTPAADNQGSETEAIMRVAVENFKVLRDPVNPNIRAQFKIKNTSRGVQRVTGNAVVLLKSADLNKNQWLVMPAVGLSGHKPSGKRGKSFSIRRFFTMKFSAKAPDHADQFQTAVVYVFTKKGQLLLEQDFTISLPPLRVVTSEPPAEETPKREAQPVKPAPRQPPRPQEPPQKIPAAPEIPGDDGLDSLENAPPVF
jgi:outer membrane biosynthesis protein TonB